MTSNPPVLLFDLDGTVLEINSFPVWAKWMLGEHFAPLPPARRMALRGRTAAALAWRKLGLTTHAQLKHRLQGLWGRTPTPAASASIEGLNSLLHSRVRAGFSALLSEVGAGRYDAILTTAAAEEYAAPFGRRLGFRHIVSTSASLSPYAENLGEAKRRNTLNALTRQGWSRRPRLLFTDHLDDMPLVMECELCCWLGDAASLQRARELAPRKRIECGLSMSPEQIADLPRQLELGLRGSAS